MGTILLIEDNANILENLTEYLELENCSILIATNGKCGLELAKKFKPDLIVCDVLMPEMSGLEVLSFLRNTREIAEIPFIFSTSMPENSDRKNALELGADDYIVKPYEMDTLLTMAQIWIKSGRSRNCVHTNRILSGNPTTIVS